MFVRGLTGGTFSIRPTGPLDYTAPALTTLLYRFGPSPCLSKSKCVSPYWLGGCGTRCAFFNQLWAARLFKNA